MNRLRITSALALAAAAVIGLAATAAAGDFVPLKGIFVGDVIHTTIDSTHDRVDINASGTAALLGHFNLDVPHVVDRTTRTAVGSYQFTAASGDTLYAEFTGQATPTDMPGILYIEEKATIMGGTGQFAGATGSFIAERWYDIAAGKTVSYFDGTIAWH